MANYDSVYTGQEVDEGITIARSFTHTPVEIDAAITTFDEIESTPTEIDNAVRGFSFYPLPSQISEAVDFVDDLTSDPADIDTAVNRIQGISSSGFEIDAAVDKLENNNAMNGQVMTADGSGGSSWQTPASAPSLYHHTIVFTKVDGGHNYRWSVEWIDDQNGSSASAVTTLTYLSGWYRDENVPKIATGLIWDNGSSVFVQGFYYDTVNHKYVLVGDEGASNSVSYSNFSGWSYYQNTRMII